MKTAAIVIDSYKLPIFKKHLDTAGYSYTEYPGITENTMLLKVKFDWAINLKPVIEAANKEATK
jgi:hypothetical protein